MNIICNNCVGGRIYQQLNIQYNNPFIWNRIYYKSFKQLITNFDQIDFNNFIFDNTFNKESKSNHLLIKFKNINIEINYTHYIQNSKYNVPTKSLISPDIYYNDIKTYTINKYLIRLSRMNYKDKRIFILVDDKNVKLTEEDIQDFLNLKLNGIKFLVTNKKKYNEFNTNTNILITNETNTKNIANLLLNKYPEIFNVK